MTSNAVPSSRCFTPLISESLKSKDVKCNDKRKVLNDYVDAFNSGVHQLLNFILTKFPRDMEFLQAKKRISTSIRFNSMLLIDNLGPIVEIFREQILSKDEDFFLNFDVLSFPDATDYKAIIDKIKEVWKTLSADQIDDLFNIFIDFFNIYTRVNQLKAMTSR